MKIILDFYSESKKVAVEILLIVLGFLNVFSQGENIDSMLLNILLLRKTDQLSRPKIKTMWNKDILVCCFCILSCLTVYLNSTEGLPPAVSNGGFYVQMHLVGISWPRWGSWKWKRLLCFSTGPTAKVTAQADWIPGVSAQQSQAWGSHAWLCCAPPKIKKKTSNVVLHKEDDSVVLPL